MQPVAWDSCLDFPCFPGTSTDKQPEKLERQIQDKEKTFVNHVHSSLVRWGG